MEKTTPVKKSKISRLPWKFETKSIVLKKSGFDQFVRDIERRLCKDLNKELDQVHLSLKQALDERDAFAKENTKMKQKISSARKVLKDGD